ncbi:hypothetical protein [Devosia sp. A449]
MLDAASLKGTMQRQDVVYANLAGDMKRQAHSKAGDAPGAAEAVSRHISGSDRHIVEHMRATRRHAAASDGKN